MAEIQKIGHWFFASDRVATISASQSGIAGLYLWATPLPYVDTDNEEHDLAWLEEHRQPADMPDECVAVALDAEGSGSRAAIVCDIPDNYALYIGDENGSESESEDESVIVHWSKR